MQQTDKAMPSGTVKEKFQNILVSENTNEIIPFMKSLSDADKKTLTPVIKKSIKHYQEYAWNGTRSDIRGTAPQFTVLSIAAFVCLNEKDYKRNSIDISYLSSGFIKFHETWQKELMKQISVDNILEWYQPEWMSRFINDPRTNRELKQFTYQEIMRWYRKGYITLSPELVVATLPKILLDYDWYTRKYDFHPERLLADPLTLEEHIWYFFTYPSDIYNVTNWGSGEEPLSWTTVFLMFSAENRIDRMRLLRETLLATTRNFNKPHTNWFVDLFTGLKPSADELLNLQDELFASLASAQTKPISTSLAYIKSICADKAFRVNDFLGCFPALFTLSTKAILNTAIDIAAEMIKADASLAPVICADLCSGFASKDESIQKKIAKVLAKYADAASIGDSLAMYADQILMSVRPLLEDLLESSAAPLADETVESSALPEALPAEPLPHVNESNRIPTVETFEDFLFFMAQAFDNNEPWHAYYVPVYVQQFDREITAERIPQLEPAFKKAISATTDWSPGHGVTDRTTAAFFISFIRHLMDKYPGNSEYISATFAENKCHELTNWQKTLSANHMEIYPWYYILQHTFDAIVDGRDARLLSTPTHTPLWIDPVVLVRRLKIAQSNGEEPHTYDLQLALQRSAPDSTGEALQLARAELKGELLDLMAFLLDPVATAPAQVEHPAWWMTATLRKNPHTIPLHTAAWGYNAIPTEYFTGQFEWSIANNEEGTPVFKINPPVYTVKNHAGKTLYSEFAYSIYRSRGVWEGDLQRLICSAPYSHDVYTAHVLWEVKSFSTADSILRPALINSLDALLQLRLPFSPTDYLLLALCLFAPDKTIKDYAASLWSESIINGNLNVSVLGTEMGKLALTGWLPLKRFTDVIETNMINISATHNRALEELIVSFLAGLDVKPLTNLKKLLEIYSELLSLNQSKVDSGRIAQLDAWEKVNNLRKVVDRIKK